MTNPFQSTHAAQGPATDILRVTSNDNADLSAVAISLYIETGGDISIETVAGGSRIVSVAGTYLLPVGVCWVLASDTTATGIHALVPV